MTDKPKRPRDANQLAKFVANVATGEIEDRVLPKQEGQRRGGIIGGNSRAEKLSTEDRLKIAKKAASVRWSKNEIKS